MSLSVISFCILLFNSVSISLHIITSKFRTAFAVTIVSVNVNDVLCGLYLCIILMVDLKHHESFLVKEELWRNDPLCFTAFYTILFFSILGPLLLVLLSLSKAHVCNFPFEHIVQKFKIYNKGIISDKYSFIHIDINIDSDSKIKRKEVAI